MNDKTYALILDILKTGGVVAGVLLTLTVVFVIFKYVLPLVISLRPKNGSGETGPLFLLLQQAATLPGELKALTDEFRTMKEYIFTRAEVVEEMQKNRHALANMMSAPILSFTTELRQGLVEIKAIIPDRRKYARRKKRRAK